MIKPRRWGTLILFSSKGIPRMIISSNRNFKSGSSRGKLRCGIVNSCITKAKKKFKAGPEPKRKGLYQHLDPALLRLVSLCAIYLSIRWPGRPAVIRGHVEAVDFVHGETQRFCHPFSVFRVGLVAIPDMTDLNEFFSATQLCSRVFKQQVCLAVGFDYPEQVAGLGVVILIIVPEVMGVGGSIQFQRWSLGFGLFLPLAITVRVIVRGCSIVSVYAHGSVAVECVVRTPWFVDRDLKMVYSQAVTLCVAVGEQPSLKHFVGGEPNSRYNVRRIECSLLHVLEIVFRISVQFE